MSKKLHNPKSNAPCAYIPAWLIQIPHNQLSTNAKMLYGRLSQWSNSTGVVHRSSKQLSLELGLDIQVIKRTIRELKEFGLIGTSRMQFSGVNHYEFYDHPCMREPINPNLSYAKKHISIKNDPNDPLVSKMTHHKYQIRPIISIKNDPPKIEEIKVNKNTTTMDHQTNTSGFQFMGTTQTAKIDALNLLNEPFEEIFRSRSFKFLLEKKLLTRGNLIGYQSHGLDPAVIQKNLDNAMLHIESGNPLNSSIFFSCMTKGVYWHSPSIALASIEKEKIKDINEDKLCRSYRWEERKRMTEEWLPYFREHFKTMPTEERLAISTYCDAINQEFAKEKNEQCFIDYYFEKIWLPKIRSGEIE